MAGSPRRDLLAFATEHFLVLSAVLLVAAVAAGTFFLAGYLSVFDWRLIWVIEYADILKVGLVGLAAVAGLIGALAPLLHHLYLWGKKGGWVLYY